MNEGSKLTEKALDMIFPELPALNMIFPELPGRSLAIAQKNPKKLAESTKKKQNNKQLPAAGFVL